jgi:hypothetical protein
VISYVPEPAVSRAYLSARAAAALSRSASLMATPKLADALFRFAYSAA